MRSTYLFLAMFLGGQAIAGNGEVRCVAKVKAATMDVVKAGEVIYSIGYENIFIPKGYCHNSCELDFPFAMSNGVTAFDGMDLSVFKGGRRFMWLAPT